MLGNVLLICVSDFSFHFLLSFTKDPLHQLVDLSRFAFATALESLEIDNGERRTKKLPARLSECTNGNTSPIVLFQAIERLKCFETNQQNQTKSPRFLAQHKIATSAVSTFLENRDPGILDFGCGDATFLITGMVGLKCRHKLKTLRGFGIEKIDEHIQFSSAEQVFKKMLLDVELHLGDFLNAKDAKTKRWLQNAVKKSQVFYTCNEAWESKTMSSLLDMVTPWVSPLSIWICMKAFKHDLFQLIDVFNINSEDIDWHQSLEIAQNIPVYVYVAGPKN